MDMLFTLLKVIKNQDGAKRVNSVIEYLHKQNKQIKVTYFSYNIINKELNEYNGRCNFKQSDYGNPVVFNFLEKKCAITKKIIAYTDDSSFKQYFRMFGLAGYCLLIPIRNIGIWGIYSESKCLLQSNEFIVSASSLFDMFAEIELLYQKNKQLEDQHVYLSQALNRGHIDNYEKLKRCYVDSNWIDTSVQGKRFKRNVLDSSKTNRTLTIIGKKGYGKKYLANVIHQLRSSNMMMAKYIDLSKITNVLELNCLLDSQLPNEPDYIQKTIILKNIDRLNGYLLELLINNLSQKIMSGMQLKVILLLSDDGLLEKRKELLFFTNEKILLSNRMEFQENRKLFLETFITQYFHQCISYKQEITDDAKCRIISEDSISEIGHLKSFISMLCTHYVMEPEINRVMTEALLLQKCWRQPYGLVQHLDLYEKEMIYMSLVESDWNQKKAAEKLMIPRRTLNYKCQKYGLGRKNVL